MNRDYVKENELFLKPVKSSYGDFSRMVLFLVFCKDNIDEYRIRTLHDNWDSLQRGEF